MNHPWLEQFSAVNLSTVEAAISLSDLANRNASVFARHEMDLVSRAFEEGLQGLEAIGRATTLQQVIEQQQALVADLGQRYTALAMDQCELMIELQGSCVSWFGEQFNQLAVARPTAKTPSPRRKVG